MIGQTISHFRILEKLGEGGMGVVYRAQDEKLRRQVALKVLPSHLIERQDRRLRFLREARAAAAVTHPNIATVHEIGEADGIVFIVMELVEGRTLRALIGGRPMPIRDAVRIATGISQGLARAHQAHVIHRDLKPDNVMVTSDGHTKILDFGLAKLLEEDTDADVSKRSQVTTLAGDLTREGRILGTVAYMSPEQARGRAVDSRTDIFSFGATLYEMVTGKQPFHSDSDAETLSAIIREEHVPASRHNDHVPPELERIIDRCLKKNAGERHQQTGELVAALRSVQQLPESGVQAIRAHGAAVAVAMSSGIRRVVRTRTRRLIAAAAALLLLAAGMLTWRIAHSSAPFQRGDRLFVELQYEGGTLGPSVIWVTKPFEIMLSQSSYIEVLKEEEFKDLMVRAGLMAKPADGYQELASRTCAHGECAGFLAARVAREGTGYRLEAAVYRIGQGKPVITRSMAIPSEDDLLGGIHDMVLDIRRALGEPSEFVGNPRPPGTRSLKAYEAVAAARRLGDVELDEQIALYERALEIDPEFFDASFYLALQYGNIGSWKEYRRYAENASRQFLEREGRSHLRSELLFLDASYDYEAMINRMKTQLQLYPLNVDVQNWLGFSYLFYLQDPRLAAGPLRAVYQLLPRDPAQVLLLSQSLARQGKVEEIEDLASEFRSNGGSEDTVAAVLLFADQAGGDWKGILESIDRLEDQGNLPEDLYVTLFSAESLRLESLLASGRLREAQGAVSAAWRQAERLRDLRFLAWVGVNQAWLDMRRGHKQSGLLSKQIEPARNSLHYLPDVAVFCVHAGLARPLERLAEEFEQAEKDSKSHFVREELAFARGSLALIRGDAVRARELLEPISRNSNFQRRHHLLGRTYEALEMWPEAAAEYQEVLKNPHYRAVLNPAVWNLNRYRLASIYERLGDSDTARRWYERFLTDWKDADPDIPELIEAKKRLAVLTGGEAVAVR